MSIGLWSYMKRGKGQGKRSEKVISYQVISKQKAKSCEWQRTRGEGRVKTLKRVISYQVISNQKVKSCRKKKIKQSDQLALRSSESEVG